uniref:Uncharacterized protein n=1 Tax=Rangifer tarandus platyrhynchus TaxID=3082113 RepID=A0ACB0E6U4_RANTA|nr:unnamed protein product [Rangifer tarandus platyrhynchus]
MKPKSKSSRRIALGRRGRQRRAGQARGCGRGGAARRAREPVFRFAPRRNRRRYSLQGLAREGEDRDFLRNVAPTYFHRFELEGEGKTYRNCSWRVRKAEAEKTPERRGENGTESPRAFRTPPPPPTRSAPEVGLSSPTFRSLVGALPTARTAFLRAQKCRTRACKADPAE